MAKLKTQNKATQRRHQAIKTGPTFRAKALRRELVGLCLKRRICFYRLGSELNFCSLLMLLSATYTGHILKFVLKEDECFKCNPIKEVKIQKM